MTAGAALRTMAVVVVVVVSMAALDTSPNVPVLAAATLVAGSVAWLFHRLREDLAPPPPASERADAPDALPDLRLTSLRQSLIATQTDGRLSDRLRRHLVAVVDDELRATHGIDRSARPDEARAVLGPELFAFVAEDDAAEPTSVRDLTRIVERIEAL